MQYSCFGYERVWTDSCLAPDAIEAGPSTASVAQSISMVKGYIFVPVFD